MVFRAVLWRLLSAFVDRCPSRRWNPFREYGFRSSAQYVAVVGHNFPVFAEQIPNRIDNTLPPHLGSRWLNLLGSSWIHVAKVVWGDLDHLNENLLTVGLEEVAISFRRSGHLSRLGGKMSATSSKSGDKPVTSIRRPLNKLWPLTSVVNTEPSGETPNCAAPGVEVAAVAAAPHIKADSISLNTACSCLGRVTAPAAGLGVTCPVAPCVPRSLPLPPTRPRLSPQPLPRSLVCHLWRCRRIVRGPAGEIPLGPWPHAPRPDPEWSHAPDGSGQSRKSGAALRSTLATRSSKTQ